MRFSTGESIAGRYQVKSFLGSGAFGEVYRAVSAQYGDVAVKTLPADMLSTKADAVMREASILAQLEHPGIVKVYEVGQHCSGEKKCNYLAMEFLPGGTLKEYLERVIRLPVSEACAVGCQILGALSCAHGLTPPIIHGDLKPDNVLLVTQDPVTIKIADFGLSTEACQETGLTAAAGTLYYMAPENLWGYALPGSDVFCAGLMIYQMLTGTSAFALPALDSTGSDKEFRRAIERSRQTPPPAPSTFNSEIDADLDTVVLKSLALDHRERYVSATDFLRAFLDVVGTPEECAGSVLPSGLDLSLPVFGSEDYRDMACSGALSQDELSILWDLYCDIETPVSASQRGAFSVVTLTGLTRTELSRLDGRSLSDWLFHSDVSIPELRVLKDIGKLLYSNPYSLRAARCGKLLYVSSIARALDKHGERISALTREQFRVLHSELMGWPVLPPRYRDLLSRVSVIL